MSPRPAARAPALALLLALPAVAAEPPPPGAASCSGCHGPGAGGIVPGLRGRPAPEIEARMRAFRAGEGEPTVMDRIARGFSEDEIRALAAWLADGG